MIEHVPWWVWTLPVWPTLLTMSFVVLIGWLRGRATGTYPTLLEWCRAVQMLQRSWESPLSTWLRKADRPAALPQQADQIDETTAAP